MGVFGPASLLLVLGAANCVNGGLPRGPHVQRFPRARLNSRQSGTTYTTSLRDPTTNQFFGTQGQLTTVNAGVTRWLSGLGTHNFYGNLNNYGTIIVSQTDWLKTHSAGGQTSDFQTDGSSANGNLYTGPGSKISLNDYGAASAPTYDWYLHTLQNYGTLQMCGRGDTGGSTYQLYCDLDCYNYGLIDMGQYYNNLGATFVWRNSNLYPPGATNVKNTYNYGSFRITNVVYHNVQNVLGTGCYIIGNGGVLYLEDGSGYYQNVNFDQTFLGQSITFSDSTAVLHMDTQVYSHNSNFGPQVYGYGAGNAIEFYEIFPSSNVFTYDGVNGVLTVRLNSGNSVNIKIGVGYDASQFYTGKNPTHYNTGGYNAIFYRGTTPTQNPPSVCAPQDAICADPETTATATAYVTTTVGYSGTGTFAGTSTTTIAPSGTVPGTVEVITPAPYASYTSTDPGAASAYTTTIPQVGTKPGTILVIAPGPSTTTAPTSPATSRPAVLTTTVGPNRCVCRPQN